RHEDHRLDEALVPDAHREDGEAEPEEEREPDVEDDPAEVVDHGSARRERMEVEEVRVVRQEGLVVVETDPVREVEEEIALVEGQADRVVGGVDEEDRQHEERRREEEDEVQAIAKRSDPAARWAPSEVERNEDGVLLLTHSSP